MDMNDFLKKPRFYDMRVHSLISGGENTEQEMINMAKELGFSGLALVRPPHIDEDWPESDIDVVKAVYINAKNSEEMKKMVKKTRNKSEIVIVQGGDYDINREACQNSMVDILCSPEHGRRDSGLDHVCAKEAKENNIMIEINMHSVIDSFRRRRAYLLSSYKKNINLCRKFGANIILTSGSISKWGMRGPRQIAAFAYLMGLPINDALHSLSSLPESIIETNRKKLSGKKYQGIEIED